ncbi:TonB family protein [Roseateles sp.]|uniref:energy transducer TonB n=1 Tax=Roseateles sp. TaxID=1971397 RepID=UPI0032656DCE
MPPGLLTTLTPKLTAIAATLLMLGQLAMAQTEAPQADKSLERAQKAADAVFHWIKLNGDKGASRQTASPAPPPAAAPAVAPAPAPRKPTPTPTPTPAAVAAAPRPAPAPAPAALPEPVVARARTAALPEPEPKPERAAPALLAIASPPPAPVAPMAVAARAVEPPPPPVEEAELPLKLLSRVNPGIPRQLQQQNFRDGFARVKFTVAPDGSVSKAEALASSHSRLGTAAIEAVKQWRFEPIAAPREVAIEFAFKNADE